LLPQALSLTWWVKVGPKLLLVSASVISRLHCPRTHRVDHLVLLEFIFDSTKGWLEVKDTYLLRLAEVSMNDKDLEW
jgi:hypothetical protein